MICRFNADLPDDQVSSESDGKLRLSKMITCQVSCQREKLKVITIVVVSCREGVIVVLFIVSSQSQMNSYGLIQGKPKGEIASHEVQF